MFVYDGDGRLAARLVDGVLETAYASGGRYEREVRQGRTTSYYALGGTTVAMRRVTAADNTNTVHYLHQDHLGSTTLQTSGDPSAALPPLSRVEGQQLRGPYGQPWLAQGIFHPELKYTGQRSFEGSLGSLYHYQARWYSPVLGRFLQADTIVPGAANPQNLNRYSYVRNNPIRFTDPSGHALRLPNLFSGGAKPPTTHVTPAELQLPTNHVTPVVVQLPTTHVTPVGVQIPTTHVTPVEVKLPTNHVTPETPQVVRVLRNEADAGADTRNGNTPAAANGNRVHYDELNGGTGRGGPSQLRDLCPETQFIFTRRGQVGPDVEVQEGSKHPSEYEGSDWPEGFDHGDFKPNTPRGARTFYEDINSDKFPTDTVPIPYDPQTGLIKSDHSFGP